MITDMKSTRKDMKKAANPQRRRRVIIRIKRKRVTKGRSRRMLKKARTRSHPKPKTRLAATCLKVTSLEVMNLMTQRNKKKRVRHSRVGKDIRNGPTDHRYVDNAKIKLIVVLLLTYPRPRTPLRYKDIKKLHDNWKKSFDPKVLTVYIGFLDLRTYSVYLLS